MLSVLGATTFWFFNELNKNHRALISYPIEFEFNRDSVVIMDPLPQVVRIDVSSGGWNLFRRTLLFSVTPLKIDLENPTEIRFLTRSSLLPVVTDQLEGLDINYLMTDTLFINVEPKISRSVDIKVDSANISLENNYRIVSPINIDPPTIQLIGPETVINSLQDEYYVLIRETRIDEPVDANVTIPLPFEDIMIADPSMVRIHFEVDLFERGRILVPMEKVNFPPEEEGFVEDSLVAINYTVQRSLKQGFGTRDFGIILDYRLMEGDSTIEPLMVFYPEHLTEMSINPEKFKVTWPPNE